MTLEQQHDYAKRMTDAELKNLREAMKRRNEVNHAKTPVGNYTIEEEYTPSQFWIFICGLSCVIGFVMAVVL